LSAISYIYSEIKTQLETVVGIGFVGKWNNQLENDSRERQFTYPCVLIEFGSVEWRNTDQIPSLGNTSYQQKGNVEITIHTLFKSVDNSSDTFEDHVDFCKLIWDSLTNFKASLLDDDDEPIGGFTPLQRVRDIDDSNHDTVRDWQTVYSSMIFEAANSQNLVDAAPVSITIIGQLPSQSTPEVVIPICADADVYLNDVPIWTVESGGLLELSIVNQDDEVVTPISIVGEVIKISDTGGSCADASYNLVDGAAQAISSGSIASGSNATIVAPNSEVTYNGGIIITAIQSNQSEDLTFEYENGDTATPTTQLGTVLTFPNPHTYDPRDLINFTTLNWTNPFGNNNRFTAIDGTQIYTAGVAIDWTSYNIPAATVVCFNLATYSATKPTAETYASTLTVGGLSVWKIGIWSEISPLLEEAQWLNYAPFNITLFTRVNSFINGTTNSLLITTFRSTTYIADAAARNNLLTRVTTLSELGL
jgi:hypothetical protein